MVPPLFFYQLGLVALVWFFLMLYWLWPNDSAARRQPSAPATPPRCTRSRKPTPFAGLPHKPPCALCEPEAGETAPAPLGRPDPLPPTCRRPRTVDTSMLFCPHPARAYRGWLGRNTLRAHGHPSGGPWRQLHCRGCNGYFPEHHGPIFHGKHATVALLVRVLACLAEGGGIRATARVFAVDPKTVRYGLGEAAEQLRAFCASFLCDIHVRQLQRDELYAVLREVKSGALCEAEAIQRLERSPSWVWTAMDPESTLLVVIDVGARTLALAQRVVHQVVQVLAASCVPLCLTDGQRDYTMAFLAHWGYGVQPERKRVRGPAPKPRWLPLPQLLYAQGVKSYRRRRIMGVKHRVVLGTLEQGQQVLAACSWQSNTAFVERLNLDIRQRVAAGGVGAPRSARARTACNISWRYTMRTTMSACLIRVCASPVAS